MALLRGLSAVVSESTSGDKTIVAAVTGAVIRLRQFHLVAAGSVVTTWKSGSTAKTGAMSQIVGVPNGAVAPDPEAPLLLTTAGEALVLTLSGNVQVSGFVVYDQVTSPPSF